MSTVPELGWASIKNGQILALMEPVFDVFLTIDGNLHYQQDMTERATALVVLAAMDNTFETLMPLMPLMPQVLAVLPSLIQAEFVKVAAHPAVCRSRSN